LARHFCQAIGLVVLQAVSGSFFGYSETWQLVINSSTTIITFLVVFVSLRDARHHILHASDNNGSGRQLFLLAGSSSAAGPVDGG